MKSFIRLMVVNPHRIFLVDGIGGLLSAFLLSYVLVKLEYFLGMPSSALYVLSIFPLFYVCFDFYCYQYKWKKPAKFLMTIAVLNVLYCLVSVSFLVYHFKELTIAGWIYFLMESIIIIFLAYIEYSVSKALK